jgi:PAS domain S-box-containing protein
LPPAQSDPAERFSDRADTAVPAVRRRMRRAPAAAKSPAAEARQFEFAARAAYDGLWDWNLVTGAVRFSDGFREKLGPAAPLRDDFRTLLNRVHTDDREPFLRELRRHLEQGAPLDIELRLECGGAYRWFRLHGDSDRDPAGRPVRVGGALRGIESERQRRDHLVRNEALNRRTLDSIEIAIAVLNARGEIIEINRAWRDCPAEHGLAGMRFSFGERYADLCARSSGRCAEGPLVASAVAEVLAGLRRDSVLNYETAVGGEVRHFQMRIEAFAHDGETGAIVTHEDITAISRMHDRLHTQRDFYEVMLDTLPVALTYVNCERQIEYLNKSYERLVQHPRGEMRGLRVDELMSPASYAEVAPRLEQVLAGQHVSFQQSRRLNDGRSRELAIEYVPRRDASGSVSGFFSVIRDITEQKRLEGELRQAQKMEAVGQLTGGLAHDFNNLLSVVIGNLQLLERVCRADARATTHVETALRAALRGAELTSRLLAFSRQQVLEPRVIDANELITGMKELIGRALGRSIAARFDLAAGLWPIRVDPGQLENSVLNLAINARDAMAQGGELVIGTENVTLDAARAAPSQLAPGAYVCVTVTDNGHGMTEEVLKRVFEPFFTTKEIGKGTGLGLSMVYGFCEQSGGRAEIASTLGVGTTVSLYFPRSLQEAPVDEPADEGNGPLPTGTETVLVVEDDDDVRTTAVTSLQALGYTVHDANSAHAALELLERKPEVDLVLTDMMLAEGERGLDLVTRILRERPRVRVLVTSAFAENSVQHQSLVASGYPVLTKPYSMHALAHRIRATLN